MIQIPFIRHDSPVPMASPSTIPAGSTTTVLVVEDELALRSLFAHALRRDGYCVFEARHGAHALVVAEQAGHIDFVVTDICMPKMDGLQLGAKLRESRPNLPILYISGYPIDEAELGPNSDVLQKPFPWQALHDKAIQAVGPPVVRAA